MKKRILALAALMLFVLPLELPAGEVYDLDPLMDRYEAMKQLRDSRFASDFDNPESREKFLGYKRLLMDCQERIKSTAHLVQLHNIFAAREGLEPSTEFMSDGIVDQVPKFTAQTRRDMRVIDEDLDEMAHDDLYDFGHEVVIMLDGYVDEIQAIAEGVRQ